MTGTQIKLLIQSGIRDKSGQEDTIPPEVVADILDKIVEGALIEDDIEPLILTESNSTIDEDGIITVEWTAENISKYGKVPRVEGFYSGGSQNPQYEMNNYNSPTELYIKILSPLDTYIIYISRR